jgi:SAM-dependent methyltransferase
MPSSVKRYAAMTIDEVKASYRSPDRDDYPELVGYSPEQVYEGCLGGGGLYLAARMARHMGLQEGQVVLDLGCGQGASSLFLASHYGVTVVAVDLWTPAAGLAKKAAARGQRRRVLPLCLDITERLPFAESYFDAIFCMNSLSFYGGSGGFLRHLLVHLKPGGAFGVGGETLSEEFTPEQLAHPPEVYHYCLPGTDTDVWENDFLKLHSPPWWEQLFTESGLLRVLACQELDDAEVLYEDLVLHQLAHDLDPDDTARSIAQIEWGRANRPRKTLFTIIARKIV